jgi:hypothetical protein
MLCSGSSMLVTCLDLHDMPSAAADDNYVLTIWLPWWGKASGTLGAVERCCIGCSRLLQLVWLVPGPGHRYRQHLGTRFGLGPDTLNPPARNPGHGTTTTCTSARRVGRAETVTWCASPWRREVYTRAAPSLHALLCLHCCLTGCLQQSKIGAGNAAAAADGSVNVYGARRTSSSLLMDPPTQVGTALTQHFHNHQLTCSAQLFAAAGRTDCSQQMLRIPAAARRHPLPPDVLAAAAWVHSWMCPYDVPTAVLPVMPLA